MSLTIDQIPGIATIVGEGPCWDVRRQALWFIDLLGQEVHRLDAQDQVTSWQVPESPAAVMPATDGRIVVVVDRGVRLLDPSSGEFSALTELDLPAGARFSEGKVDRAGRLVAVGGDAGFRDPIGSVVRWNAPGEPTTLASGLTLGNGPAWSRDGSVFYVADSLVDTIWRYADTSGALHDRTAFFSSAAEPGFPDGATVDAEDHLWVVLHHSPFIVRLRPDGTEDRRIEMPTDQISSLAFGGPDLTDLYVTSIDPARLPMLPGMEAHRPEVEEAPGGGLYRVRGLGVAGLAEVPARM
jgi:L-arabinonolactonase